MKTGVRRCSIQISDVMIRFLQKAPAERRGTMDNGLNSYNRFLSGEKDAIDEIIKEYKDGLVYYLFGITRDTSLLRNVRSMHL